MKTIDRLFIKARKKLGSECFSMGIISILPSGKYEARGDIWNGKKGGSVKYITSIHNTLEDAKAALQALSERYPNRKNVPILIDDIRDD